MEEERDENRGETRRREWDSRTHSRIFQLRATRFAIRPPAKSNSIAAIRSPPPSFVLFGNIIERLQKSGTHARPDHHSLLFPPPSSSSPRVLFSIQLFHLELKRRDSSLSFPFSPCHVSLVLSYFHSIFFSIVARNWKRLDALHLRRYLLSISRTPRVLC